MPRSVPHSVSLPRPWRTISHGQSSCCGSVCPSISADGAVWGFFAAGVSLRNMQNDTMDLDVLDRVLAGEASVEERAQVAEWLERSAAARDIVAGLRDTRLVWDVDAAWRKYEPAVPSKSSVLPLRQRLAGA